MPPKKAPARRDVYVILGAERVMPKQLVLPDGYPDLHSIGEYRSYPAGGPKGAKIVSDVDGPIEDIYTMHFVATADVPEEGTLVFQPEAQQLFDLIAIGSTAAQYGPKLADDVLARIQEMIGAGLTHAELAGEIASMRKQVKAR